MMNNDLMKKKEKYTQFCEQTYIPIFSQPWWLDAVCGKENWDVWLYDQEGNICAAMPYYLEKRGKYKYITKPSLTQNNGLIIKYPLGQKNPARLAFEEKIINEAMDFIDKLSLDVYEQQFHYSVENWVPYFWRGCTAVTRYTFVIKDTSDIDEVFSGFSPNCRKNIRKGQRKVSISSELDPDVFYNEHEKIFKKQGLTCPFSRPFWHRLHDACKKHNSGETIYAFDKDGNIHSLMFMVWDKEALYPLLGGYMTEFASSQSYSYLTFESIKVASQKGLKYDFEGSVIKRINHSFRDFGGIQIPYFRIRKIYNSEIVRKEAEESIILMQKER